MMGKPGLHRIQFVLALVTMSQLLITLYELKRVHLLWSTWTSPLTTSAGIMKRMNRRKIIGWNYGLSVISDDEGRTWKRSNFIDIGGHGHHDGATEPTVAELSDGRMLMLIRTNLGCFWQAISENGGRYWRIIQPSSIDASSSPGHLIRLHSGRLVLVWNRLNPEGRIFPRSKPDPASEVAASWHREELSISFSEDDGKSWQDLLLLLDKREGN